MCAALVLVAAFISNEDFYMGLRLVFESSVLTCSLICLDVMVNEVSSLWFFHICGPDRRGVTLFLNREILL
jgi:hypothetical protein